MLANANLPVILWFIFGKFCGINLKNDRKCYKIKMIYLVTDLY